MNVIVFISLLVLGMMSRALAQAAVNSVLELIIGNPNHAKFSQQLLTGDRQLAAALNSSRQFTAFVPTDVDMANVQLTADELRNHFISESLDLNTITSLTPKPSMSNRYLWMQRINGGQVVEFHINGARVRSSPYTARNGLIYNIDSILNNIGSVKPLLDATRERGQEFSQFSDLLSRAQLAAQLNSTQLVYTMFVAENKDIYPSLVNTDCASNEYLADLLKRHVLPGRVLFKPMLLQNGNVNALNGQLTVTFVNSTQMHTLQSASAPVEAEPVRVTRYGYPTANGVMHVIDRLLYIRPTILDHLQTSSTNIFLEKLNQLSLMKSQMCNRDSAQQYTLFVFTDAAFNGLPDDMKNLQGDQLKTLMDRHVLETALSSLHIGVASKPYRTMGADTIYVKQENGEYIIEHAGMTAKLTNEVVTDNGVIYSIDQVLVGAAPSLNAATSLTFSLVLLIFKYFC